MPPHPTYLDKICCSSDVAKRFVPFGQYKVNDAAYNKLGFSIHNYFLAKALDQIRPGGILAFVTSRIWRHRAVQRDRYPKQVIPCNPCRELYFSDILFLQKRDTPCTEEPAWVQTAENADGFSVNQYFMDNPNMVLGNQTFESTAHGMDICRRIRCCTLSRRAIMSLTRFLAVWFRSCFVMTLFSR